MLQHKKLLEMAETCGLDFAELIRKDDEQKNNINEADSILSEVELSRLMQARSSQDIAALNFLAAGCYNYFTPASVRAITSANQFPSLDKNLSLKFDIEAQLVALTGMPLCSLCSDDVVTVLSNLLKSIDDSCQQSDPKSRTKILLPATISPAIRNALRTQLKIYSIDPVVTDFDKTTGFLTLQQLEQFSPGEVSAIVLPWPNFFGLLEEFETISRWAKTTGAAVIGLVNPMLLSYLKSPADIFYDGVDYLLGDCQVLGLPTNRSGVAACFVSGKEMSLPVNLSFESGVSNDLLMIHSFLSTLGVSGMSASVERGRQTLIGLIDQLQNIEGVTVRFLSVPIHECVIQIAQIDLEKAFKILTGHNMVCGYNLADDYPELHDCLLIHCNDQHDQADIAKLSAKLATVVKNLSTAACPVKPKF